MGFVDFRTVAEVFLAIAICFKGLQLFVEGCGLVNPRHFFGRCLRRIFPTTSSPDYTTGTFTTLGGVSQTIVWAIIVSYHKDLEDSLVYVSVNEKNEALVRI